MKKDTLKYCFAILFLLAGLTSCKKEKEEQQVAPAHLQKGLLVLNEGLFQLNNSALSWVNLDKHTVNLDFFTQKTERLLGDTGNDMKRYGGKIYIVVNVSSTVEVLDASTGKSLKQISMLAGAQAKQPRNIAFCGKKVYITCFDGFVDVLDTASLQIETRIQVGLNPEDLTVSGNRLFVSNSGGLNGTEMDSTVSVIDLSSHIEIEKIVVGKNPGDMLTDHLGNVYVVVRGNYSSIPSRLKKINPNNLEITKVFTVEATGLELMDSKLLILNHNYTTQSNSIHLLDVATETIEQEDFIDLSSVTTLYGVHYLSDIQQLAILDANQFTNSGSVKLFNLQGDFIRSYTVGLNPTAVIYFK
jgi:DNA-binding beta-propeller fold protein YncE